MKFFGYIFIVLSSLSVFGQKGSVIKNDTTFAQYIGGDAALLTHLKKCVGRDFWRKYDFQFIVSLSKKNTVTDFEFNTNVFSLSDEAKFSEQKRQNEIYNHLKNSKNWRTMSVKNHPVKSTIAYQFKFNGDSMSVHEIKGNEIIYHGFFYSMFDTVSEIGK